MLNAHPVWSSVINADSFENFQKHILPEFHLNKNVPDEVRENISIVSKLLLHSYFEYYFIDIALTQLVFTLEKALKIRYKEINDTTYTGNFKKLIIWFFERNYFETYNSMVIHQLRNIRNGKVHEERNSLGGIVFLSKVRTPITLINDVYEDRELRTQRKELISSLESELNGITKNGGIFSIGEKRIIIEKAVIGFLNNKKSDPTLYLVVLPIHDPEVYMNKNEPRGTRPTIELQLTNWNFSEDNFTAEHNEEKITIHPILKQINKDKFTEWCDACKTNKYNKILNDFGAKTEVDNIFLRELEAFHRMDC